MAKKKETGELEVRLTTEQARKEILELEKKVNELEKALDAAGTGNPEERGKILEDLNQTEVKLTALRNSLKTDMRLIINGEVAGKSINEVNAALKSVERELKFIGDESNPEFVKKAQQAAVLRNRIAELEAPIKKARTEFIQIGEEGSFTRLSAEATRLNKELESLSPSAKRFAQVTVELNKVESELKQVGEQLKLTKAQFTDIGQIGSLTYLQAKAKALRAELEGLSPATAEFIAKCKQLNVVEKDMAAVNRQLNGTTGVFSFLNSQVKQFGILAAGYLGLQALGAQVQNFIQGNMQLADSITNVAKYTGLAESEVRKLTRSFKEMDTRSSQKELLELAGVAGRLGLSAKNDVLAFVRAADQINVALAKDLGGSTEDAINKLGKLTSLFKIREKYGIEDSLKRVGSVINELGAASEAKESYIADFASRLGGIAPNANISYQAVAGLGATLDALGQTAEVSTTSIGKLLVSIGKDTPYYAKLAGEGTDAFRKRVQELGYDANTTFSELLGKDANAAMIALLDNVKSSKIGLEGMSEKLTALGVDGARSVGVIGVLTNNIGMLKQQQALANKAFDEGTSLTKEFDRVNNNFAASVEKLQKRIAAFFVNSSTVNFAKGFIIGLNELLDSTPDFEKHIKQWKDLKSSVDNLQSSVTPMLGRYDELKVKASLNKDEQAELDSIIEKLSQTVPSAVTEFDKYGKALGINSDKVREFVKAQQTLTSFKNADAIKSSETVLKQYESLIVSQTKRLNDLLKTGQTEVITSTGVITGMRKVTDEEFARMRETIIGYNEKVTALKLNIRELKGQPLIDPVTNKETTQTDVTNTETNSTTKINVDTTPADNKLVEFRKKIADMLSDISKITAESIKETAMRESALLDQSYQTQRTKALLEVDAVKKEQKELVEKKAISNEEYQNRVTEFEANTKVLLLAINTKYEQDRQALVEKSRKELAEHEFQQDTANLKEWNEKRKLEITNQLVDEHITRTEFIELNEKLEAETLQYKLQIAKDYGKSTVEVEQAIADNKIKIRQQEFNDYFSRESEKLKIQIELSEKNSEEQQALIEEQIELERDKKLEAYQNDAEMRYLIDEEANKKIEDSRREHIATLTQMYADMANQFMNIMNGFYQMEQNRTNASLDRDKKANDAKKKEYKKQLDAKEITREEYDKKIEVLDNAYQKKVNDAKRQEFENKKDMDTMAAIINTAVGATKAYAQGGTYGAALAAIIVAAGAIQIATIQGQEYKEMEQGGFIVQGPSHKEGGLDVVDTRNRKVVANIEGGEAAIVSKETTREKKDVIDDLIFNKGRNVIFKNSSATSSQDVLNQTVSSRTGKAAVNYDDPADGRALVNFDSTRSQTFSARTGKAAVNFDDPEEPALKASLKTDFYDSIIAKTKSAFSPPKFENGGYINPTFTSEPLPQVNTSRVLENLIITNSGINQSQTQQPVQSQAINVTLDLAELKTTLARMDVTLNSLEESLRDPSTRKSYIVYSDLLDAKKSYEQALKNAQIGK
jgi:TP901 family phage tail tape measure protein